MVDKQRSFLIMNQPQWDIPVPYLLNSNLSMVSKGIIMRAFEQFRLKSCIDFKPRTAEDFYISVEKHEGCWSSIGRAVSSGQTLSIGDGCAKKTIVEHEFLHALGFIHELSRYDRDNYVTIVYENIRKGHEGNFIKYTENRTRTGGVPYDYTSVMHYNKNAYSNGNGPTIITKFPEFKDVIGQHLDMSEYDVLELNNIYKCNSSISFLDHCSFDNKTMCQMSVCSTSENGWKRVSSVRRLNVTDHTYLGKQPNGSSFFMHFSTEARKDSGRLASKIMTPKRDCKTQCLQFYYFHSGNENDQLNIWIREYKDKDSRGTLRPMDQISEPPSNYWQLRYVPLNANKAFQVEFEARRGAGNSSGGFSLDDINISETECPQIWQIRDFEKLWSNTKPGKYIYSPLFYSWDGYRYQVFLGLSVNYFGIYVRLVSGANDNQLQWPFLWRQVTFQVLDQNPHIQKRMSYEQTLITEPTSYSSDSWDNPQKTGTPTVIGNETVYVNSGLGFGKYMYKADLTKREFIKGGDIIFLFSIQDISGLLKSNSVPCPKVTVKSFNISPDERAKDRSCDTRALSIPQTTSTITTPAPTKCEHLDRLSNSNAETPSCLILLVVLFVLLVN
ncbi:meprin A subunit beta-like [Myxocyprinus asiaticus]|uniref:meprin A subunit beta-like n=1 Tax=Myxocyprinus asiaticus TaxID=70543 RepID=UPI002222E6FB|nr:meprin A subunit beta-like [Myxocyprinus asiaticus]XP_051575941.1 meprin A subunit beta-like [Myxocyprinus asiaticus]